MSAPVVMRAPYGRKGDEMDLPEGMTCGDCEHCYRCTAMFGHIPADEVCDWSSSRFRLASPQMLMPCPFCGSVADLNQDDDEKSATHLQWAVTCSELACNANHGWYVHARKGDAIKAWNTRALSSPTGVDGVASILAEVERATAKFPTWPTDPLHAVAVLGEKFGELVRAVLQVTYEPGKATPEDVATEAMQTAAMALRFVASLGNYDYARCPQHKQGAPA